MIEPSTLADAPLAVLLAALAAGNPPRRVTSVPATPAARLGIAVAFAALPLLTLGVGAGAVLEALAISRPTARVAAGLVLVVVGLVDLVRRAEPLTTPGLGVVVPLAFPILLRPELALVVVVAGADHGAAGGVAAALAPLAAVPMCALALRPTASEGGDPWWGAARWLSALAVLLGVGLLVDGIVAL